MRLNLLEIALFVLLLSPSFGQSKELVKIAVMGPLSGPAKVYGQRQLQGARLAAEQINESGGLSYHIEVVAADDEGQSGKVGELARDLIFEDGVSAFIGCVNSSCTHVLEMICVKTQKPQITCISTDPSITRAGTPWIFRCLADDIRQAESLANYLLNNLKAKRIALLTLNNRYGQMGARTLHRLLRNGGQAPIMKETFQRGNSDRSELAKRVSRQKPDAIVVWSLYSEAAQVVSALRDEGVSCPLLGPDGVTTPAFLKLAGKAAEGMVVTYPFNPERPWPKTQKFLRDFKKRWSVEADSFAAHAYDAMMIMASALKRGGKEAFSLRDELAKTAAHDGVTGHITFDATGNDTRNVELAIVKDGRYKALK